MGKRGKYDLDNAKQAREAAKKERKRKKKAEARFKSAKRNKQKLDQTAKDFFAMCDKKRAYRSEMDAMMAAAHSRSGDPLRWYKCPFAPPSNPHWHLTKMSEEAFEERREMLDKKKKKPGYKKPPIYVGIEEPCFVAKSSKTAYPVMVFKLKVDALKWASKNNSFEPIDDNEENRAWLDALDMQHYEFAKSGILCIDMADALRALDRSANKIWTEMENGTISRLECYRVMLGIRKNYRRLDRETEMNREYQMFLETEKESMDDHGA